MGEKRVLIVYYSRSGNTKKIASELAKKLSSDLEELIESKNRNGVVGDIKSAIDAIKKGLWIDKIDKLVNEIDK